MRLCSYYPAPYIIIDVSIDGNKLESKRPKKPKTDLAFPTSAQMNRWLRVQQLQSTNLAVPSFNSNPMSPLNRTKLFVCF